MSQMAIRSAVGTRLSPCALILLLAMHAGAVRAAAAGDSVVFFKAASGTNAVDTRLYVRKGETVHVWVDCAVANVTFSETRRDSVFVQDLKQLLKRAEGAAKVACPPQGE